MACDTITRAYSKIMWIRVDILMAENVTKLHVTLRKTYLKGFTKRELGGVR